MHSVRERNARKRGERESEDAFPEIAPRTCNPSTAIPNYPQVCLESGRGAIAASRRAFLRELQRAGLLSSGRRLPLSCGASGEASSDDPSGITLYTRSAEKSTEDRTRPESETSDYGGLFAASGFMGAYLSCSQNDNV